MDEKPFKLPEYEPPPNHAWPFWVWWAVGTYPFNGSRVGAVLRICAMTLILLGGIRIMFANPSLMGLFIIAVLSLSLVHTYLAVRWVDRNDGWPD